MIEIDRGGRIIGVRADSGRPSPTRAIFPGLVNAHAHLQLGELARAPRRFVPWLRAVIGARGTDVSAVRVAAEAQTEASLTALLAEGCTAVGEIDSLGTSPAILARRDVAGRCYQELLGFDLDASQARALVRRRARPGSRACGAGLSPHAPYSVSAALVSAADRAAAHLSIHVAESVEEIELLRAGTGPLRRVLEDLGKWPRHAQAPRATPIAWLDALGILSRRCLLVHAQHATDRDIETVAARGAPVAVCPSTIRFFGRPPPDIGHWRRAGVVVALGTDSAASRAGALSMRTEMALAAKMWPDLSAEQILTLATREAACAIGRPGLGRIAIGGRADLCAVELPRRWTPASALAGFVRGDLPLAATWLAGRCLDLGSRAAKGAH